MSTITLTPAQISALLRNMRADDEGAVRYLALSDPSKVVFTDDDSGREFSADSVARLVSAARDLKFNCYCCTRDLPITSFDRDSSGVDLCGQCYEYAGWENTHSDYDHENHPDKDCPVCNGDPMPNASTPIES